MNEFWASYVGRFRACPNALAFGVQPRSVPQAVDDGSIAFIGICNRSSELHAKTSKQLTWVPCYAYVCLPIIRSPARFSLRSICELWIYLQSLKCGSK